MPAERQSFDEVLWGLSDESLSSLRLEDFPLVALSGRAPLPQITIATALCADASAVEVVAAGGVGVLETRETTWGGLLRAQHRQSEYVVAVVQDGGVVQFFGSQPYTDHRWRRVEESWVSHGAPLLSPVSLGRPAFERLASGLSEYGRIGVSRLTARVLDDHSSYTRGWKQGQQAFRAALAEIGDNMTPLTFTLSVSDGRLAVHLRRNGGATYYSGQWPIFLEAVVTPLRMAAAERFALLNESRKSHHGELSRLVLALGTDRLQSESARTDLLDGMRSLRGVRLAVMHENPYLHVLVSDHLDGSSFDVFVTDDAELHLIPGTRASLGALGRVTDALADALGLEALSAEGVEDLITEADFLGLAG